MVFNDIHVFRSALREYVSGESFEIIRKKNERTRVTAQCKAKDCPWRIHDSIMQDNLSFMIKTYNPEHTCVRVDQIREANSTWLESRLVDVLRENPQMKPKGIRHELKKYGVNPPYMQLYWAKGAQWTSLRGIMESLMGRVWEVTGIPCRHATLAIAHKRDKLESFTQPSFSKENYMKAYSHMIQAIPNPQFWPPMTLEPVTILPPPLKRLPGRPRVNRRREVGEDGAVKRSGPIKCSKCFGLGHNTRTCQRAPVRQRKKIRSSQQDSVPQGSQQADMAGGSNNPEVVVDVGSGSRGRVIGRSTRGRGRRGNKSVVVSTTRGMRRGINTPIALGTKRREEGQTSNISKTMTLSSQPGWPPFQALRTLKCDNMILGMIGDILACDSTQSILFLVKFANDCLAKQPVGRCSFCLLAVVLPVAAGRSLVLAEQGVFQPFLADFCPSFKPFSLKFSAASCAQFCQGSSSRWLASFAVLVSGLFLSQHRGCFGSDWRVFSHTGQLSVSIIAPHFCRCLVPAAADGRFSWCWAKKNQPIARHEEFQRFLHSHRSEAAAAMLGFAKQPTGRIGSTVGRGSTCYCRPDFLVLAEQGVFPAFSDSISATEHPFFRAVFSNFRPLSVRPEHWHTAQPFAGRFDLLHLSFSRPANLVSRCSLFWGVLGPTIACSAAAIAGLSSFASAACTSNCRLHFPCCTRPFHDHHPSE
ncbi:hypothetical protein Salat_2126500 [Sesamum alatum]|uniref:Transposase MuDR plant domain-containing protein n=1 Tax=Sesamum alatum TaxID=300844 RepID=A0AAE2CH12_9LAMI|nr:hypothetical protein Salat_2126500 [Sesamum alatum]